MKLTIANDISPCSIDISCNYVVIGGSYQVLVINWVNQSVTGIDFCNPCEFKEVTLSPTETPFWKGFPRNSFIEFDGEFRVTNTAEGPLVKGGIGILYHKTQFDLLHKGVKLDAKVKINPLVYTQSPEHICSVILFLTMNLYTLILVNRDEWILEKGNIFNKEYDQCNDLKYGIRMLAELCESIKIDIDIKVKAKFYIMSVFINNSKKYFSKAQFTRI
jgi:hypothetical protein